MILTVKDRAVLGGSELKVLDLTRNLPDWASASLGEMSFGGSHKVTDRKNFDESARSPDPGFLITRIDSPRCLLQNGRMIHDFEPERFFWTAVLLDLTGGRQREVIDDEDLEAAEEFAGLAMREGELAIIKTGWDPLPMNNWPGGRYPVLSENAAEYLRLKHVSCVGIDTPNIDQAGDDSYKAHSILLGDDILILENLCNLDTIQEERFSVIALPLKVKAVVAPVRALALTES